MKTMKPKLKWTPWVRNPATLEGCRKVAVRSAIPKIKWVLRVEQGDHGHYFNASILGLPQKFGVQYYQTELAAMLAAEAWFAAQPNPRHDALDEAAALVRKLTRVPSQRDLGVRLAGKILELKEKKR